MGYCVVAHAPLLNEIGICRLLQQGQLVKYQRPEVLGQSSQVLNASQLQ